MIRWASIVIVFAACARSGPPPARLFADGAGGCPDAGGCDVPVETEPRFAPPDEDYPPPGTDPELGPAETREASCTDVGISAASIEVGNYADEETRAPTARKFRARCLKARLGAVERQCVFEAADAATIAWCAPRFWPQLAVAFVEPATCAGLTQPIRDRMNALPDGQPGQEAWARQLAAVQRSCEEDRWTVAFGQCASSMQTASYVVPYCQHVAPAPLVTRLQDRLAKLP